MGPLCASPGACLWLICMYERIRPVGAVMSVSGRNLAELEVLYVQTKKKLAPDVPNNA